MTSYELNEGQQVLEALTNYSSEPLLSFDPVDPPRALAPLPQLPYDEVATKWSKLHEDNPDKSIEELFCMDQLAYSNTLINRYQLLCMTQPKHQEVSTDVPLFIRNQLYLDRQLASNLQRNAKRHRNQTKQVPKQSTNDSSSRISIAALISAPSEPILKETSSNSLDSEQTSLLNTIEHIHFDENAFFARKQLACTKILPQKRVVIDPADFLVSTQLQHPVSMSCGTVNSHIDIDDISALYADKYLYISALHDVLEVPRKFKRLSEFENILGDDKQSALDGEWEHITQQMTKNYSMIIRNDIYRQYRQTVNTRAHLISLAKKTAISCQREVKKTVLKSVRAGKDSGNRGKKLAKEVMMYWRRHDKEQRGAARRAQKEASESRKRDEEIREAKRQQRKLNFLLTQTELYAHFIGKKVGVESSQLDGENEGEADGDGVKEVSTGGPAVRLPSLLDPSSNSVAATAAKTPTRGGRGKAAPGTGQDSDDELDLAQQASAATEKAIKDTYDKMRAFDEETNRQKAKLGLPTTTPSHTTAPTITDSANPQSNGSALPQISMLSDKPDGPASTTLSSEENELKVNQPSIFAGALKKYQMRGLNWLVNLYDQGINGILADDMGLGKTIQTIAFLSHLAEEKDIWGPFLVIAPVSTLHNWLQEIARFTPALKALPYWGTTNDRKVIRRYWTPKHMYTRSAPLHIIVTSYQLVVQDEKYFRKVKWQYMVLDEAHALKSSSSMRWKTLLSFHCRNRLLLTGTPIQNNMAELWALLHFIMPSFFDSHDEFNDWFSKDIENHAEGTGILNEQQLSRLHTILKPFMLRRVKQEVENEMVKKTETEYRCQLTERQKRLYKAIKAKISLSDLILQSVRADHHVQHLMNLVMQFRKVCNHPELFERRGVISPFQFQSMQQLTETVHNNPIQYQYPKLAYRTWQHQYESPTVTKTLFNIFSPTHIDSSLSTSPLLVQKVKELNVDLMQIENEENHHHHNNNNASNVRYCDSTYSFSRFCSLSPSDIHHSVSDDILSRFQQQLVVQRELENAAFYYNYTRFSESTRNLLLVQPLNEIRLKQSVSITSVIEKSELLHVVKSVYFYSPSTWAYPIVPACSDRSFEYQIHDQQFHGRTQTFLYGSQFKCSKLNPPIISYTRTLPEPPVDGLLKTTQTIFGGLSRIFVPGFHSVINDSGKLKALDSLLITLKAEGHRVLIYSQMTKMLDLLEEFMNFRKYTYHRLDGGSKLAARRDMVTNFQNSDEVFVFLLSTRAGGLGINLTAADTVIFYDSDWNPTMDAQAMDRAHRLGQTRPVTVYRLVTSNTIEERILTRAKEKHNIQNIVISGGKFEAGAFSNSEVVSLLLDDNEVEHSLMKSAQEPQTTKGKKGKKAAPARTPKVNKRKSR